MSPWSRRGCGVVWLLATLGAAAPAHVQAAPDETYARELSVTLEAEQQAPAETSPGASASSGASRVAQRPELLKQAQTPDAAQVAQASRTASGSKGQASKTEPRLGVVLKDGTRIYRRADSRSPELFRCAKGTALGLVGQTKKYYAVLMIDRSYGFVEKSRVELYNYAVTIDPEQQKESHRIVQIALEYMGVPYVWGGNTQKGIDCSGFVKAVFKRLGVELPRVAREQINVGRAVRWGELAPGDRLYFSTHGQVIDHTGIYIGGGRFIHASGGAGAVVVSSVTESKYYNALVAARRI